MIGKYCGSQSPLIVTTTSISLFMMLRSDASLSYRGFNASYELVGEQSDSMNFSKYLSMLIDFLAICYKQSILDYDVELACTFADLAMFHMHKSTKIP